MMMRVTSAAVQSSHVGEAWKLEEGLQAQVLFMSLDHGLNPEVVTGTNKLVSIHSKKQKPLKTCAQKNSAYHSMRRKRSETSVL
ncbi:hypothetical protein TNCV_1556541 [Trichonephila clavipes]|nr:hypothetical protein TNCV_1556541 [Trichonephila clavipes]